MGRLTKINEEKPKKLSLDEKGDISGVTKTPEEPGFFKKLGQGIALPFLSAGSNIGAAAAGIAGSAKAGFQTMTGDKRAAQKTLQETQDVLNQYREGVNFGAFGSNIRPIGSSVTKPSEVITKGLPDVIAKGTEVGLYGTGAGEIGALGGVLRGVGKTGTKEAVKAGGRILAKNALIDFTAGGLGGAAIEAQNESATPGSIIKEGIIGGGISTFVTPLLGGAAKAGGRLLGGAARGIGSGLDTTATRLERYVDTKAPKTTSSTNIKDFDLEVPLERPVKKAVNALWDDTKELGGMGSSGFHSSMSKEFNGIEPSWGIVYQGKVPDNIRNAAEDVGLRISYRADLPDTTLAGRNKQNISDIYLPNVSEKNIDKATMVFDEFAEKISKEAPNVEAKRIFEDVDKPVSMTLGKKAADVTAKGIRVAQEIPIVLKKHLLSRYTPIGEFRAKAQGAGIDVPDLEDMAQATGYVATGKAQNRLDDYTKLIKTYGNDWSNVKEASRYLDALDRLSLGNAIEGGYKAQDVKEAFKRLATSLSREQRIRVTQGMKELQAFLNKELEDAITSGRLSKESFDQIKKAHPNYIPHDVLDYLDEAVPTMGKGTGKSLQLTKSGIEKAKGSKREIDDIDNAVVRRMFRQQLLNEKNKTMTAIIDAGEKMGEQHGFIRVEGELKTVDIPKELEKVSLFRSGKKEDWLVPKELGLAIKNMGGDDANVVMQWLNNSFFGKVITSPATLLRSVATGINPVFTAFSNPFRDVQTAQFTAKSLPQDFAFGLLKSINANLRGVTDDELYRLAREAGALQGTLIHEAQQNPAKLIVQKLNKGNIISKTLRSNWNPVELTKNIGSTMEEMTRLAVFKRALMQGATPQAAAKIARNATVDFGKAGYTIQILNRVVPFLNARIQGFTNLAKAVSENPEKAIRIGMITSAYPAAVLTAYNQKYESYENIPDHEKRKFWIVMVGELDGFDLSGNPIKIPEYIKLPKGEAQQAISNVVERTLTLSKQRYPQPTAEFIGTLVGDISPVTESSLLPAGLQQAIELQTNYSLFRQRPIESEYTKVGEKWFKTADLPPEYRIGYSTSEVAKSMGRALGWSPTKIDYIIKTGVINELVRTSDLLLKGFSKQGMTPFEQAAELPAVRSILGTSSYGEYLKEKEQKQKETQQKNVEKILQAQQPVLQEPTERPKGGRLK